jgi:4'-phosphopantetheinyl transferase
MVRRVRDPLGSGLEDVACVRATRFDPEPLPGVTAFRLSYRLGAEPDRDALDCLLPDELERMHKFRFVDDRVRYAATRSTLRRLLGKALELEPARVPLETAAAGKPVVAAALGLEFNVSHSGGEGIVALSRAGRVGVDVEQMRQDIDHRALSARVFAPAELEEFDGLDDAAARHRFYRGWVYKEAVLKALGLGIGTETRAFAILERDALEIVTEPGALPVPANRLHLVALSAPAGYCAALAYVSD